MTFYARPQISWAALLEEGQREDQALLTLLSACFVTFLSTVPVSLRDSYAVPEIPFQSLLVAGFFAWVFIAPLAFYVLALCLWAFVRVFKNIPTFQVRRVLFEAFFMSAPLLLIFGLVRGYLGDGAFTMFIGALWAIILVLHLWIGGKEAVSHV